MNHHEVWWQCHENDWNFTPKALSSDLRHYYSSEVWPGEVVGMKHNRCHKTLSLGIVRVWVLNLTIWWRLSLVCLLGFPALTLQQQNSRSEETFKTELFLNKNELNSGLYEGEVRGRRRFGETQVLLRSSSVGHIPWYHHCYSGSTRVRVHLLFFQWQVQQVTSHMLHWRWPVELAINLLHSTKFSQSQPSPNWKHPHLSSY